MFDPNMTVHEWVEQIYPSYVTQRITPTSTSIFTAAIGPALSRHRPRTESETEREQSIDNEKGIDTFAEGKAMTFEGDSDTDLDRETDTDIDRHKDRDKGRGRVVHSGGLQECTTGPGEMLYFPAKWMHATLNMSPYNVFVSLFIDLQLLR